MKIKTYKWDARVYGLGVHRYSSGLIVVDFQLGRRSVHISRDPAR